MQTNDFYCASGKTEWLLQGCYDNHCGKLGMIDILMMNLDEDFGFKTRK
jgi:hypothetical protein